MKRQILFSAAAVLLAVGGAFASGRFADTFYPAGDSTCAQSTITTAPCPVGSVRACVNNNNVQYYYKINGEGDCLPLLRP